ncbi:short-chain dehydrogenase [Halobacteriales archaeon QS_4_70_19]|nr:MAG: short-chain dehydrogenase [Halobacteriales archaeon QS_4_70_19]
MADTVLVAGVGPRIGEATVRTFHAAGYDIGMFARSGAFIEDLAADLGDGAVAVETDITDEAAVAAGVGTVREALGPVGTLVLNASAGGGRPLADASVDRLRSLFDVRVAGSLACVQAAADDLRETEGTVLFSGTTFADGEAPGQIEWGAVAPAARGLARTLADALEAVQVTYVAIGAPVRPDAGGERALPAATVAETYLDLVEREDAVTRELDLYRRD